MAQRIIHKVIFLKEKFKYIFSLFFYIQEQVDKKLNLYFQFSNQYLIKIHTKRERMNEKLSNLQLLQMIISTYKSTNTQEINQTSDVLRRYVVRHYPSSFRQLEDIMTKEKNNLDRNQKKAIINLAKVAGFDMLKLYRFASGKQQQLVSKQKNLLFTLQHILDNKQIQAQYRQTIVDPFIDIFVFHNPQNMGKILSKSRYYLNTKEEFLGLKLLQAYKQSKILFKFKAQYHQELFLLLIEYILNKQQFMKTTHLENWSTLDTKIMKKYIEMLQDVWVSMTFQKHEEYKCRMLNSMKFIQCLYCFLNNKNIDRNYIGEIYSIVGDIVMTLGRCNLYHDYAELMTYIKQIVENEFLLLINGNQHLMPQTQASILNMISNAIKYKLIQVNFNAQQLYIKLIYPNYLIFQKYFNNHCQDIQEIINFINDASFYMQSTCQEISRNKLLLTICKYSEESASAIRSILYNFYTYYLPQTVGLKPIQMSNNYVHQSNIWEIITIKYPLNQVIISIMFHTSIFVSFVVSDFIFIETIAELFSNNALFFFKNQNPKITFYSLLIYKNYMDDSFDKDQSLELRRLVVQIALKRSIDLPILNQLAMEIIKERLNDQPKYEDYERQIDLILEHGLKENKEKLYGLVGLILRVYGERIRQGIITDIMTAAIDNYRNIQDRRYVYDFLDLFKEFFKIKKCRKYIGDYMNSLLHLVRSNMQEFSNYIQQFLNLIKIYIQITEHFPQNSEQFILRWQIVINNKEMLQIVNKFISKSQNPTFFTQLINKITNNQLTIQNVLILHSIIYYGQHILTLENIKKMVIAAYYGRLFQRYHFNYINGKINLIFIYLLRYCWKEMNYLLLHQDWSQQVLRAKDIVIHRNLIGREDQIGLKPFVEEIYDLVYKQENIYRWKYDIETFLKLQLELILMYLSDPYQLMYANLIFVAITNNMKRAFDFIKNNYEDSSSESDESLHPRTTLQKEYRAAKDLVQAYDISSDLKEKDYFSLYRNVIGLLRKNTQSQNWMNKLLQIIFKAKGMQQFNKLLVMQKNQGGKYRKINRIKRLKNEQLA